MCVGERHGRRGTIWKSYSDGGRGGYRSKYGGGDGGLIGYIRAAVVVVARRDFQGPQDPSTDLPTDFKSSDVSRLMGREFFGSA